MLSGTKWALTIFVIISMACSAFAIHCYHCDSNLETKCGEKFNSQDNFKVDCDRLQQQQPQLTQLLGPFIIANATGCVKKIIDFEPEKPRIQRSCFYGDLRHKEVGCHLDPNSPPQLRMRSCDVCTGDFCNGSSRLAWTGAGVTLFLILMQIIS